MNYGETIAFWHLRLNGFFPLANLVVHYLSVQNLLALVDKFLRAWWPSEDWQQALVIRMQIEA